MISNTIDDTSLDDAIDELIEKETVDIERIICRSLIPFERYLISFSVRAGATFGLRRAGELLRRSKTEGTL